MAVRSVKAGDIVCIAGLTQASVSDTIASPAVTQALTSTPIDPPTISVTITVNDDPLAGTEGDKGDYYHDPSEIASADRGKCCYHL